MIRNIIWNDYNEKIDNDDKDNDGDDNDDDDDSAISLLEELSTGIDHTREKLLLPPPENTHTKPILSKVDNEYQNHSEGNGSKHDKRCTFSINNDT